VEVKGRKPMRLYRAESVSGLAKTGTVVPVLTPKPPTKTEISAQRHVMASLHEVMTKFLEQNRVSVRHKIWLSLEEAQAYSGRSRKYLLKLVKEGRIFAEKDGGWRIHRASLEAFAG
jgi:excisionase family DNA binding protein